VIFPDLCVYVYIYTRYPTLSHARTGIHGGARRRMMHSPAQPCVNARRLVTVYTANDFFKEIKALEIFGF